MVADDLEPALNAAPVVVGQLQDEEVLEEVAVALGDGGHWLYEITLEMKISYGRVTCSTNPVTDHLLA